MATRDLWHAETGSISARHGLLASTIESWLANSWQARATTESLPVLWSRYLGLLAGIFEQEMLQESEDRKPIGVILDELGELADMHGVHGLSQWAAQVRDDSHPRTIHPLAVDLCVSLAQEIQDSSGLEPLRERDHEWGLLPVAPPPSPESEPGSGLPLPSTRLAAPDPARRPLPWALLVQPPTIGRDFLCRYLNQREVAVDTADNTGDALRALARGGYELVFIDVDFFSGQEVGQLTRQGEGKLSIVLLSDSNARSLVEGADWQPVLGKPPSEDEIDQVLRLHLSRNN